MQTLKSGDEICLDGLSSPLPRLPVLGGTHKPRSWQGQWGKRSEFWDSAGAGTPHFSLFFLTARGQSPSTRLRVHR